MSNNGPILAMGYLFLQISLLFPTLCFFLPSSCTVCSRDFCLSPSLPPIICVLAWMQDKKCKHSSEDFEKERQKVHEHAFIFFSNITVVFPFPIQFWSKSGYFQPPHAQGELSVLFSVKSWHSLASLLSLVVTCTENESHTFPSTSTAAHHWMLGDIRVGVGKRQQKV